jgi:streptogramin lyase
MQYVSTAEEGIVWAIDDDHDVWVLRNDGTISMGTVVNNAPTWTLVPNSDFTYIDVGRQGQLVAVTDSGCSFWMRGITNDLPEGTNQWYDLTNNMNVPATYFKFNTISICDTGSMWATLKTGDTNLYFRSGRSREFPWGLEWTQSANAADENLVQASCGFRGYVWAVGASGALYRLDGVTADTPQGTGWTKLQ